MANEKTQPHHQLVSTAAKWDCKWEREWERKRERESEYGNENPNGNGSGMGTGNGKSNGNTNWLPLRPQIRSGCLSVDDGGAIDSYNGTKNNVYSEVFKY